MKHYIISLFSIVAVLCSSCTKESAECSKDEISVVPSLAETKATLIPAGDLTGCRIHIDGYIKGSTTKHLDGNILYENSKWIFYTDVKDVHYYWPQHSNLDVMAYSPAKLDSTHITILSPTKVKCTKLPMIDSLQTDKKFNEFIVGYNADCSKNGGAISVVLNRPYAAINFYLNEAVRSTLNDISIEGLYSTGEYSYNVSSGTFEWGSLADKSKLFCGVNKVYPVNINNGSHLGGPFLVIPQTFSDDVKLVFSYKSTGNAKNTITETTLNTAATSTSTTISKWEPGKVYNYWINLNGAADEVRMSVTVSEWDVEGNSEVEVK